MAVQLRCRWASCVPQAALQLACCLLPSLQDWGIAKLDPFPALAGWAAAPTLTRWQQYALAGEYDRYDPVAQLLQAAIDRSQEHVEGTVRLKLYKGNVIVVGRKSPKSLYKDALVTFEDDRGAYDQKDAAGFIKLNALRLRLLAQRDR